MPAFELWALDRDNGDRLRVYAIDEWDARDQVTSALGVPAQDEAMYACAEKDGFKPPLNVIVHANGEQTPVPEPYGAACRSSLH